MKKLYLRLGFLILVGVSVHALALTVRPAEAMSIPNAALLSPNLVISQFQTRGVAQEDEFVELHNTSSTPVDLNGFRMVYRSSNGVTDVQLATWTTTTIIPAGAYYLIASTAYNGPAAANITYNSAACQCGLSATGGGMAVRNASGTILDSVGWGTATNAFVEAAVTIAPAQDTSQSRLNNACQDTDNNANDFANMNPAAPRNASSIPNTCSGSGTTLFAAINANPSIVYPGGTTLLTVTVIPATTPPSTGIMVVGNLSNVGGASSQQFFDNGTNGDATAGDNIFSYQTVVGGMGGAQLTVSAVASDTQARSANVSLRITINGCPAADQPLALGNPSNATSNVLNETNYLMEKPQYSLSYHRTRGIANWVAWRLDSSWIGTTERQDDFRPDTNLPGGWYQVLDQDYSGSGFDRGHHIPSGDRTCSIPDNSATFLMTNIMPQAANNNQGPWEELETYARTLAGQGNELYMFTGGVGQGGTGLNGFANTIAAGRVAVPAVTWKVILVLPAGTDDANRISKATRTIAVIMPNQQSIGINTPWRNFRTTVKAVEALTGLTFFSDVRPQVRMIIKQRIDVQ